MAHLHLELHLSLATKMYFSSATKRNLFPGITLFKKQSCFVLQPPGITQATKINLCPADLPAPIANLYAAFLMALAFWHAQAYNGCGALSCFSEAPSPLPPFQHVFTSLPCSSWVTSCQSEPWLFSVEGRRGSN